jgi:amino acid transporter
VFCTQNDVYFVSIPFRRRDSQKLIHAGALLTQLPLAPIPEKALLHAQLLAYASLAAAGQFAGVGSSAVFFLSAVSTFVALLIDRVTSYLSASTVNDASIKMNATEKMRDGDAKGADDGRNKAEAKDGLVSLWTYALGQTIPLLTGTQLTSATLVVFVPLVRDLYFSMDYPPHTSLTDWAYWL